jgi:hypothetical protein
VYKDAESQDVQLEVENGSGKVKSWVLGKGSKLPPGLKLGSTTGKITGKPTKAGSYPFTIKYTDSFGGTDTEEFSIIIAP